MSESDSEYRHGEMTVAAQIASYSLFGALAKWGSLGVATVVLMLTLWFCTGAGFVAGLVAGVILVALGVTFLRSKPDQAH